MFLDFYHLREQPFTDMPDPRFLYLSPTHREALAALLCGIEMDRSFLALIAEPGMGKTTLVFELLERMRHMARTVFLFQDQCDSLELLHSLVNRLGGETSGLRMGGMLETLNNILVQQAQPGKRFVLVIDEAQNLDEPVLETVRLLSNFGAAHTKPMQIILTGQPLLAEKLASPGLAQLRQRISILGRLSRFDAADTAHYIAHRLTIAGHSGDPLFTPEALEMIGAASQGIPRNINSLCSNALLLGYAQGHKKIDTKIMDEAVSDLDLNALLPSPTDTDRPAPSVTFAAKLYDSSETKRSFLGKSLGRVALAAILLLVVLFFSFRNGSSARMSHDKPFIPSVEASVAAAAVISVPSEPKPGATLPAPFPLESGSMQSTRKKEPPRTITVIVEPKQTLRQICLRHVGRFDGQLVAQIQNLNPWMDDPNRLEIGQQIQLPGPPLPLGSESRAAGVQNKTQATGKP